MATPRSVRKRLRLSGRAGLMLGLGALSTAGAQADTQTSQPASGDASVRSDGGKIYLSAGGRETELRLGATPQRERLLRLLEEHGSAGVKIDSDPRLIISGGGGTGFSLWDIRKSLTDTPAPTPRDPPQVTTPPSSPEQRSPPHKHNPAADKKG
jgi:hypothetical protein